MTVLSTLASSLLLSLPAAPAQAGTELLDRTSTLELDAYPAWKEAFDGDRALELEAVPLGAGRQLDLVLRPVHVMEPGGVFLAMGKEGPVALEPTITIFRGEVADGVGQAFFAMTPEWLEGRVIVDGETHRFSSGIRVAGPGWEQATRPLRTGQPGEFCQVVPNPSVSAPIAAQRTPVASNQPAVSPVTIGLLDVIVDCDQYLRAVFASDVETANYALLMYAAMNEIYRRDIGVLLQIPSGSLRVWSVPAPWEPSAGGLDLYYKYSAWWRNPANPDVGKARAFCHLFSSSLLFVGGVAGFNSVCSPLIGVAISACNGHFPFPIEHTSDDNWDLYVSTHEVGHVLGSEHSFDYKPKIRCNDGTGPDEGTLMSYCYQRPSGVSAIGLRFHERVQHVIRARTFNRRCPGELIVPRGDWDLDGLHRPADLAAFDRYQSQGFVSVATEEAFDLDGNGAVDALDRNILVDLIDGSTASQTTRNGSGVNPVRFSGLGNPKLGKIWNGQIKDVYPGPPAMFPPYPVGMVLGFARPASGSLVAQGEVLVDLTSALLLSHVAPMNWVPGYSFHPVLIPGNPSLAGETIYAQGVIFSQDTKVYATNALDLHLGY